MTVFDWNQPALGEVQVLDATASECRAALPAREWTEWLHLLRVLECTPELPMGTALEEPDGVLSLSASPAGLAWAASQAAREALVWPPGGQSPDDLAAFCEQLHSLGIQTTPVLQEAARMHPVRLARVVRGLVEAGCSGLMLDDAIGSVRSGGVAELVRFVIGLAADAGGALEVTWSSSQRDGMTLARALEAVEGGARRIRATALGEPSVPLELLVVNLVLEGRRRGPARALADYCRWAERCLGRILPVDYPVFGCDAFRVSCERLVERLPAGLTHAELHASGVPASWFGASLRLELGLDSGPGMARRWLQDRGLPCGSDDLERALQLARGNHRPTDLEVFEALRQVS